MGETKYKGEKNKKMFCFSIYKCCTKNCTIKAKDDKHTKLYRLINKINKQIKF